MRLILILAALPLAFAQLAAGQRPLCEQTRQRAIVSPGNQEMLGIIGDSLWQFLLTERATGRSVRTLQPRLHSSARLLESFTARVSDTGTRLEVAEVLAVIMMGQRTGFTEDQAIVASELYRIWNLPLMPVGQILADRTSPLISRKLAVRALEPHWRDTVFLALAMGQLCELALRAEAVSDPSSVLPVSELLSHEEFELLDFLVRSLAGIGASPPIARVPAVSERLPQRNPVTMYLRRFRL